MMRRPAPEPALDLDRSEDADGRIGEVGTGRRDGWWRLRQSFSVGVRRRSVRGAAHGRLRARVGGGRANAGTPSALHQDDGAGQEDQEHHREPDREPARPRRRPVPLEEDEAALPSGAMAPTQGGVRWVVDAGTGGNDTGRRGAATSRVVFPDSAVKRVNSAPVKDPE